MTNPTELGRSYFAPSVRLVALGPVPSASELGDVVPPEIAADIVRVEVTRVATGVSQYSITLNNVHLETALESSAARPSTTPTSGGVREVMYQGSPVWPRFKYNDYSFFTFGRRFRVEMRYWPDQRENEDEPAADRETLRASHHWVPMIAGPVVDIAFNFGQGAQVTVTGQDDLTFLQERPERRIGLNRLAEMSIVRRVVQEARFPFQAPATGMVPPPEFVNDDSSGLHESLSGEQMYLEYLQRMAERLDFEVFMEFAPSAPATSDSQARRPPLLAFHFEPCRARAVPKGAFRLHRERQILDFAPTISVKDQYTSVRLRGRHRDHDVPDEVEGVAEAAVLADEVHVRPGVDPDFLAAPMARMRFYGNRTNKHELQNQPNLDPARARVFAEATLRKKARDLQKVQMTTVGLPTLRAGHHVEVRGFRPPFDGFYYVTKSVHTLAADGFRTKLTASRPAMPIPSEGYANDRTVNP